MNYGARSVINEVQTLAIQMLAESQIRGDIRKKCASFFIHLFNIIHVPTTPTVGLLIYSLMMLAT